jgi:hypothetical protein
MTTYPGCPHQQCNLPMLKLCSKYELCMAVHPLPATNIAVEYSCDACGVRDAVVQVRARWPQEDVKSWMRAVALALSIDHRKKSPHCRAPTMTLVKIPLPPGHARIGDPTAH